MSITSNTKGAKSTIIPWLICFVAAIFYSYEYLLRIIPGIIDAELMAFFKINAQQLGILAACYYWAYTPMQLPVGVIMDRYGPRLILSMAVVACALGSLLFGCTDNYTLALIGRFLVGFGSAFAFVGVLKLATIWLPPDKFAMVSGLTTSLGVAGAVFGQLLLSKMKNVIAWDTMIVYLAIFGIILTPIMWFLIKDKNTYTNAFDTKTVSYTSFKQLFKDISGVICNPQVLITSLVGCLLYMPLVIFAELWCSPYFRVVHDFSDIESDIGRSAILLGWAVGAPILGYLSDKLKRRKSILLWGSLLSAILFGIFMYVPGLNFNQIAVLLFLFGVINSVEVVCFAVSREHSPIQLSATTIATTNCIIMVGGMIMHPVVGAAMDILWTGGFDANGVRLYTPEVYQTTLSVIPLGLLISAILCLFLKETYAKQQA